MRSDFSGQCFHTAVAIQGSKIFILIDKFADVDIQVFQPCSLNTQHLEKAFILMVVFAFHFF